MENILMQKRVPLTKEELIKNLSACFKHKDPSCGTYGVIKVFLSLGYDHQRMEDDLSDYMQELRVQEKGGEEDVILDCISVLVGYCAPSSRL